MEKVVVVYDPKDLKAGSKCWRIVFGETEIPHSRYCVAAFIVDREGVVDKLVAPMYSATIEQIESLKEICSFVERFLKGELTYSEFNSKSEYFVFP